MALRTFRLTYDEGTDVLTLHLGLPRENVATSSIDENILLHIDETTGEVIGMTVTGLSARQHELDRVVRTITDQSPSA